MIINFSENELILCLESGIEIRLAKEIAIRFAKQIQYYYEGEGDN